MLELFAIEGELLLRGCRLVTFKGFKRNVFLILLGIKRLQILKAALNHSTLEKGVEAWKRTVKMD